MTNTGKIARGFLLGATLGTAMGILFAPKKGTKTRAVIASTAKDVGNKMTKNYEKAKDMLGITNHKQKEPALV
jgi:gas vesicle protein